ncbi:MAG: UDP-N-acetylmuramyl pentapeptide phosphotransferase, partial [Desulfamplus sp.]|nr:UDP-N-acetylmuramyl pentapeptide phosphotransferase [Desulfamplus sp.]
MGVLDRANHRSSHQGAVPKGGGIGILAAFLFASWILSLPVLLWSCVGIVSLFSLCGDYKHIHPKYRLTVQFIGSFGFLLALFFFDNHSWQMYLLIPVFSVFITGTANYYNFMDGINGIAGITGIVAFGLIALFVFLVDRQGVFIVLSICIVLSCLAFLPFNMPKAKVFMG